MKKYFFCVWLFLLSFSTQSIGQTEQQWKEFLDDYCETYFEGCFYWKYYEITSISNIETIATNKKKITGTVKNGSFFGIPFIRNFEVDVKIYENKIVINFKKEGDIGDGPFWTDCKKDIYR